MKKGIYIEKLDSAEDTGTFKKWYKHVGETVTSGEILYEVETDLIQREVKAPFAGEIVAIFVKVGDEVRDNDVVALVDVSDS